MTPDEIVHVVHVAGQKQLLPVQELILRQAWKGETYASMAEEFHYEAAYLKKVAFELWHLLSDIFQTPISKANLRAVLGSHPLTLHQQKLLTASQNSFLSPRQSPRSDCQFPGGAVPVDTKYYISHSELESVAHQEISRAGGFVRVKGASKIGKSSFLMRMLDFAAANNYKTAYVNFRDVHRGLLNNSSEFLRWFSLYISHQLGLQSQLDDYWQAEMGANLSCTLYFHGYVLQQEQHPLVLLLDGLDHLANHGETADMFSSLLCSWYERAQQGQLLQKLRVVVSYCSQLQGVLATGQSLWDVGLPLRLPRFNLAQIRQLAQYHQFEWAEGKADVQWLASLKKMTGGHPYLVQLAFYYLSRGGISLEQLLQTAPTLSGIYHEHLRDYLAIFKARPELAAAFKQVLGEDQGTGIDPMLAYELDDLGLVELQGNQVLPSCDLYRIYFGLQF